MATITFATMKFYTFITMSTITLAILFLHRSKEVKIKKLLRKELSTAINPFQEIPQEKFRGEKSRYRKAEHLTFQTGDGIETDHVARLVQQTLECCGFKSTVPVRRNGGVHTLTITRGKNQFLVKVLDGLHVPNSFLLSVAALPVRARNGTD